MKNNREKDIQYEILTYLNEHYLAIKYVGNRNGIPDIIACIDGRFVGFEVKKNEVSKPSVMQIYQINKIKQLGGYATVVRSLNDVINFIDRIRGINGKKKKI